MRIILRVSAPAVSPALAICGAILAACAVLYALLWMVMAL